MAESTRSEPPVTQGEPTFVHKKTSSVDQQLSESLYHAVRLRPVWRADERKHELSRCSTISFWGVIGDEENTIDLLHHPCKAMIV